MQLTFSVRRRLLAGALLPLLGAVAAPALAPDASLLNAQTTTASIRGVVSANGAPVGDVQVAARNVATNQLRGAATQPNGTYYIGGLQPGSYEITARRIGLTPQTRTIQAQVGQTLDVNFNLSEVAAQLTTVQVVAAPAAETRTTEVATNVSQQQVNNLPTPSRNFLDLATLAPGTRITPDRINGTGKTFAAGAQPAEQVNVFVDGASYKNDIISGGVAGQDASRGNPFPRNAIQEFRIVTNNFKAEYQKASSAIITAVTKSGTNKWQGSLFSDLQNQTYVALDTFARRDRQRADSIAKTTGKPSTFTIPDYKRYLFGGSAGGPIIQDKLFFFGSYEGNYQDRMGITRLNGPVSTFPGSVQAVNNTSHTSPFRENLGFAKLTYAASEAQQVEVSGDIRHEVDTRGFGGQFGDVWRPYSSGENHRNNVYTGRVRDTYTGKSWVNEALVSYQHYLWNQDPIDFSTPIQVQWGNFWIGGDDARQILTQNRLSLRNDFTYTGFEWAGSHAIKVGANYDFTRYDMNKQLNENPKFIYFGNTFTQPDQAQIGFGNGDVRQNNSQFGVYAQDDWSLTHKLLFNLGVRWDVETGMINRNYVTPQAVRDSIIAYDPSLFVHVDPNRYFTNGNDRKLYLGGIQPRVGASYAIDEAQRTVVFGAFGIFVDRLSYNSTLDETYRRQHPNYTITFNNSGQPGTAVWDPKYFSAAGLKTLIANISPPQEVFLIPNDIKPPMSNQWSLGLRQDFGSFNASATYNGTRSRHGFTFEWANVGYNPATNDCCVVHNIPAYQNVLVGNNNVHTWYDALLLQVNRPYRLATSKWGWGGGLSYTLSKADQQGNDLFSFPQVWAYGNTRHPITDDRRHQFVFNWIADVPYAWGIQFSGLAQLASGTPFQKTQFVTAGSVTQRQILGFERSPWFKNVDVRLRKDFLNLGGNRAGVTASVFNVLNTQNLGCFEGTYAAPWISQPVNPQFGKASCTISDPRRFQLGLTYDFF